MHAVIFRHGPVAVPAKCLAYESVFSCAVHAYEWSSIGHAEHVVTTLHDHHSHVVIVHRKLITASHADLQHWYTTI